MTEKEYIEREAAKNAIYAAMGKHDEYDSCERKIIGGLVEADNAIDAIPAADVQPVVHGEWIRENSWSEGCGMGESYGFYYKCSVCKDVIQGDYKDCGMKYCPNCGTDMRQEPT